MKTKVSKRSVKVKSSIDNGIINKPSMKREKGITIKKESLILGVKSAELSKRTKDKKKKVLDPSLQQIKVRSDPDAEPSIRTEAVQKVPDFSLTQKKKVQKDKKSRIKKDSSGKSGTFIQEDDMRDTKMSESLPSSTGSKENSDGTCSLNKKLLEGVCSGALELMNLKQKAEEKVDLFGSQPQPIVLQITLHKIPRTPYRIIRCLVPKPTTTVDPDICLIVPDLQRGRKRDATFAKYVEQFEEKLRENGAVGIKQIIPFTQLRCEYSQFEMKRRLAHTYDLFVCDGRIQGHCYHFLGKIFEKAKKVPVPIEAMRKVDGKLTFSPDLQGEIDKATRKVSLTLHSHGTSYCVPVGHSHFTKNELARNVEAIWKVLEKELPGGVQNIRAAYLKGLRTCAVPLYASLVPPKNVPVVQSKETREPVEDELSTLPGRKVIVYPSGDVKVINNRTPEDLEFAKLNPRLEHRKGSKKRKNAKDGKSVDDSKRTRRELVKNDPPKDDIDNISNDDSDDEFKDVEDAEAAYLSQWSESSSLKELEMRENNVNKTKSKKKKHASKSASNLKNTLLGKKGISQKYSKGKSQQGKEGKAEVKSKPRSLSKSKKKKTV